MTGSCLLSMLIPVPLADSLLRKLQDSLAVLSPELIPIHERLVNIRRQLVALAAKETAREVALAQAKAEMADYKGKAVYTEPEGGSVSEPNSRTPTRESTPTPRATTTEGFRDKDKDSLRVKAELKPIQEELRKIDSLSDISLSAHICSPNIRLL